MRDTNPLHPVGVWVVAVTFAGVAMASVAALLIWDALPQLFPPRAHLLLAAVPLGLVAIASLLHQATKRPRPLEVAKAIVLAAFLCWAANQLLPDSPGATLLNDLAIALFVADVLLAIVGWPPSLRGDALGQAEALPELAPRSGSMNGSSAAHPTGVDYPTIQPTNPRH